MSTPDSDLCVNLDLVVEDHSEETCKYGKNAAADDRVATGYLYFTASCDCIGNPVPVCEAHYAMVQRYLAEDGYEDWQCNQCGGLADVLKLVRK